MRQTLYGTLCGAVVFLVLIVGDGEKDSAGGRADEAAGGAVRTRAIAS